MLDVHAGGRAEGITHARQVFYLKHNSICCGICSTGKWAGWGCQYWRTISELGSGSTSCSLSWFLLSLCFLPASSYPLGLALSGWPYRVLGSGHPIFGNCEPPPLLDKQLQWFSRDWLVGWRLQMLPQGRPKPLCPFPKVVPSMCLPFSLFTWKQADTWVASAIESVVGVRT